MSWYEIDVQLLPVKGVYFFTLASVSALFSYLSLFMKEIGLTMAETGIIWGVMPFMGGLFRIAAGMVADKLQCHKSMLISASILSGIVHCLLLFVPHANEHLPPATVMLSCGHSNTILRACPYGYNRSYDGQQSYMESEYSEINYISREIPFVPTRCVLDCQRSSSGNGFACFQGNEHGANSTCQSMNPLTNVPGDRTRIVVGVLQGGVARQVGVANMSKGDQQTKEKDGEFMIDSFLLHDTKDHAYKEMKCSQESQFTCTTSCDLIERSSCQVQDIRGDTLFIQDPPFGPTFWWFSVIFFFGQIAFSPIFNLIDAVTYDFLGEKRHLWGKQRLWGTVGNGVFAISSGLLMDLFSKGKQGTDYTAAFSLFVGCEILCAVCCFFYKVTKDVHCKVPKFSEVVKLIVRGDMLLLLSVVILFGMWHGIQETFLFLHLEKINPEIPTPRILFGFCLLMNSLPQIILFFFSGSIIEKFGHVNCIAFATLCFGIRQVGYTIISDPWYVLPFEGLNALTFGLFYAAVSGYGSIITPNGLHGSVQGIIGSLYFGVGRGLGCLEAGPLIQSIGISNMFLYHGYSAFACTLIYLYIQKCHIGPKMAKNAEKLVVAERNALIAETREINMADIQLENQESKIH